MSPAQTEMVTRSVFAARHAPQRRDGGRAENAPFTKSEALCDSTHRKTPQPNYPAAGSSGQFAAKQ